MIIPPAAITIGAIVVVAKLLFFGLFNGSGDRIDAKNPDNAKSNDSVLMTSCRYESKTVPFRDLASTSKTSRDDAPSEVVPTENSSNTAEYPHNQAPPAESPPNQTQSDAEASVNTDE